MRIIYKNLLLLIKIITPILTISAQNVNITIDLEQQRFLGEESNLDRAKYFNIHMSRPDDDTRTFLQENNVGFGRGFFGPFADRGFVNPIGNFPTTPATRDGRVRPVTRYIATANAENIWRPDFDTEAASNAAVRYFVDVANLNGRPEYWEPFNEPFVTANKDVFTKDENGITIRTRAEVIQKSTIWFREMARKIHSTPELAKMKVIGFSSAFPSYARRDFSETWRDQTKLFIDVAGEDIDALSIHPYDGVNVIDQDNRRSGSNSEAIFDLVETYSAQKFGIPKKLAISEFGIIEDGFAPGPAPSLYNEATSAITIRGINSMLFNFFERQDNIEIVIPFITGNGNFFYNNPDRRPSTPYIPAIVRPTEILPNLPNPPFRNNTYVLTYKQNFYKLWKDIKGNRATISSDDIDVQAQVFVDGNDAYIALNNLDDADKIVDLNFISGPSNISSVLTKKIIVKGQNQPFFDSGTTTNTLPSSLELKDGETKIIKITYNSPIEFSKSIVREKHYATSPTQTVDKAPTVLINANSTNTFNLSNINKGTIGGTASLRISVGIPLRTNINITSPRTNLDRLPNAITFNGTSLPIPTNWKGYDQDNRSDFFGTFEIDVPYDIINDGDNTATVTYAKTGGRIACVVLSIERKEGLCNKTTLYADNDNDGLGDPNDTIESCGPVRGYVSNANDQCLNDINNLCLAITIPGIVEAEDFILNNGVVKNTTKIESINNGDATTYDINALVQNFKLTINAAAANDAGGTIRVLSNNIQVGLLTITGTGGFNIFQPFDTTISLANVGIQSIRLEYSGIGNSEGLLFDIDSFSFESLDPISRFSPSTIQELTTDATSFTVNLNYTTVSVGQRVLVELRRPNNLITPTNRRFLSGASVDPPVPGSITNRQFTVTIPTSARPLIPGDYPLLTSIRTPNPAGGFRFGFGEVITLRVTTPSVNAMDDSSFNNPIGAVISKNILANDEDENENTPSPANVTVDINPNITGVQSVLSVINEGEWNYNPTSGSLSFTPNTGFINNPTDITYTLTSNSTSDAGIVNFEYVQAPIANNDISADNTPGIVTINILNNDTTANSTTLTPTDVIVDLNPTTTNIETTLSAGIIGEWSYDTLTGVLTFTPSSDFTGNPPPIIYSLTEITNSLSDTAEVTITFAEFTLAGFTVRNIGETCASEDNGVIEINSDNSGIYTVVVTGTANLSRTFTENTQIENLNAGDYDLVITNNSTSENFEFNITISEPSNLNATTSVSQSSKQVNLNLSGGNEFTVTLNGEEFTTIETNLTLDLKNGVNNLLVEAEKECQGKFSQRIIIGSTTTVYPNPVIDNLTIETGSPESVLINVYTISGALLVSQTSTSPNGISEIQMSDFASGIYFITVGTSTGSTSTFKIVK